MCKIAKKYITRQLVLFWRVYNIVILHVQCTHLQQSSWQIYSHWINTNHNPLFLNHERRYKVLLYFNHILKITWNVSGTPNVNVESSFSVTLCFHMCLRTHSKSTALTWRLRNSSLGRPPTLPSLFEFI